MNNKRIKDFQNIKEYCNKFDTFSIYDYLYFIGITNVIEDMPEEDLNFLIDKCSSLDGDYTDPIEVGQSIATSIEDGDISIEQIKHSSVEEFKRWYYDSREFENDLTM